VDLASLCCAQLMVAQMQVGNWDIEICDAIPPSSIHTGSCFISCAPAMPQSTCIKTQPMKKAKVDCAASAPRQVPSRVVRENLEGALIIQEADIGSKAGPIYVPAFLAKTLRPHQEQGVRFLTKVRPGKHCCISSTHLESGIEWAEVFLVSCEAQLE
jgi:hypothetical protein